MIWLHQPNADCPEEWGMKNKLGPIYSTGCPAEHPGATGKLRLSHFAYSFFSPGKQFLLINSKRACIKSKRGFIKGRLSGKAVAGNIAVIIIHF
jgi:hypothetical protein